MRDETGAWPAPMLAAVEGRPDIDPQELMRLSRMPAAEAGSPLLDDVAKAMPPGSAFAIDWVRYGRLRRQELGWDETYPAYPDFPDYATRPDPQQTPGSARHSSGWRAELPVKPPWFTGAPGLTALP